MRLLLTGGAGYIGSHCAAHALRNGHEVVVLDNCQNSSPDVIHNISRAANSSVDFVKADIRDTQLLAQSLREFEIDSILHFAGLKSVGDSSSSPLDYYETNVAGTLSLLRAMKSSSVSKLVFSSSATVYGVPHYLPIDEDHPLRTTNPYGETKLQAENIIRDIARSDPSFSAAILRYFNPVGADVSGEIGETPQGVPANLMPYVADVAAGLRPHVSVFGDDYDTRDGTGVRDYIHVSDLADAPLAAVTWTTSNYGAREFNLGNGVGTTVMEMISAFEAVSGRTIPHLVSPRRPGDVGSCYADPTRANRELGWKASRDIHAMCESAWRWRSR